MAKEAYICIAECPELDLANEPHCVTLVEEIEELSNKECPCGNTCKWVKVMCRDGE